MNELQTLGTLLSRLVSACGNTAEGLRILESEGWTMKTDGTFTTGIGGKCDRMIQVKPEHGEAKGWVWVSDAGTLSDFTELKDRVGFTTDDAPESLQ